MNKWIYCVVILFVCIALVACGAESKYNKYVSEHTLEFDDYSVQTELNTDKDTYLAIIDLCIWASKKYDTISDSYSYKALSTYMHENNLSGEYYDKFDEAEDALITQLQNEFAVYMETILENSSEDLKIRKNAILSYFAIAQINTIEAVERYRQENRYQEMFSLVVLDESAIDKNFVAEIFYTLYPAEILEGCQEYILFSKNFYQEYGNERLSNAKAFLASIGKTYEYASDIANSSEYLNSKIVCYVSDCKKTATIEIIGFSGQSEFYCSDHYQEILDIIDNILGN